MKILVVTNLYPPHHAGSFDLRCEIVVNYLRQRGHEMRVLTSNHGLKGEQRDREIERRLWLNGVHGHPLRSRYSELKGLETHNHAALRESISDFPPDLLYVWSLHGLPKSLTFALANSRVPVAYDVADNWIAEGIRLDPWLRWWNQTRAPVLNRLWRAVLEASGQRARMDRLAPTRLTKGFDRLPSLYGSPKELESVEPNSIGAFRFERIYFCSQALKEKTERAGFRVSHAEVIYPGVPTEIYFGEVKPENAPFKKLLLIARLNEESGAMAALEALREVRASGTSVSLGIYGRGESEYVAQLRSFAVTHQLPVEFLTVSDQSRDLAAVYRQHDAFLYTAEWDEPFSTRPLEAMACGLPVICSRISGLRELLRPQENSLSFTPGHAADLAARILELCRQPSLRREIANTGQAEVLQKFNEAAVVDRIETYLTDSLAAGRGE